MYYRSHINDCTQAKAVRRPPRQSRPRLPLLTSGGKRGGPRKIGGFKENGALPTLEGDAPLNIPAEVRDLGPRITSRYPATRYQIRANCPVRLACLAADSCHTPASPAHTTATYRQRASSAALRSSPE